MIFGLLLVLSPPALAADGDPFTPATSLSTGTGTLQGESPELGIEGISAGVAANVARDLVVYREDGGGERPILSEALATELIGGWTVEDRLRIDLSVPVYLFASAPWADWQGATLGDIRLQSTIPVTKGDAGAPKLALIPRIGLPTGKKAGYLSRGFSAGVTAAVGGTAGRFGWVGNAGLTLSPSSEIAGTTMGSTFDLLAGGSWQIQEGLRAGAEADLSVGLPKGLTGYGNTRSTGHLFAQVIEPSGLGLTAGVGTGLIAGVGAPDWRLFAALTYSPIVRDTDKDGLLDPVDACPIDPEDMDGFEDTDGCPDSDNDADGIADPADGCPMDPEDVDGFEDTDGCPELDNDKDGVKDLVDLCPLVPGLEEFLGCPDTDKDGIPDSDDQCPDQAGPRETGGCPDTDKDLVPDFRDACPRDPKPPEEDPATSDGCPKRVYIIGTTIHIGEKVFFETGKAVIKPESFGLLDEVAKLLVDHREIRKIEVAGHTDDVGSAAYNLKLSQQRADSVAKYIMGKGVAKERVTSKGYGEGSPIDTNRTDAGKSNNRRVEFQILQQDTIVTPAATNPVPVKPPGTPTASPWSATPDATPAPVPAGPPGKLTIVVMGVGWADVYIDDVRLPKTAPFHDIDVASGTHKVSVVNHRENLDVSKVVVIPAGGTMSLEAARDGIRMAQPGAAPWGEQPTTPDAPAPTAPAPTTTPNPWGVPAPAPTTPAPSPWK
jgi:outer membrane protein OmpA-like peptidoglycan-associated protein